MTDKFTILPGPIQPNIQTQRPTGQGKGGQQGVSFDSLLDAQVGDKQLKFSRHAQERMATRNIQLNTDQMARVESAVQQASGKGCRDSLVLVDDQALVVSVKNNTVVTVMDRDNLKNNVFTNIDSAVIA